MPGARPIYFRRETRLWGSDMLHAWRPMRRRLDAASTAWYESLLEGIVGCELAVQGTHGRDHEGPEVEALWMRIAEEVLSSVVDRSVLFVSEGFVGLRNRLRRHQMGIPRGVPARFVEVPVGIESILAAVMPLSAVWNDGWFDLWALHQNFIVITDATERSRQLVSDDLVEFFESTTGGSDSHWEQIVSMQGRRGNIAVRLGGDGGDEEMTIQFYGTADALAPLEPLLRSFATAREVE